MAEKTQHEAELSRQEAAEYLRSLSTELADEGSPWTIEVGNKQVEMRPPSTVTVDTAVTERSRLLGDDVATATFEFRWKQEKEADEGTREGDTR